VAYNFPIIEDCLHCTFREHRVFCDLPREALVRLQSIKATSVYPKGTMLCLEGQAPRGIYVLCTGKAKISTTSSEGKSIILRIAEPGEVLGLTAAAVRIEGQVQAGGGGIANSSVTLWAASGKRIGVAFF